MALTNNREETPRDVFAAIMGSCILITGLLFLGLFSLGLSTETASMPVYIWGLVIGFSLVGVLLLYLGFTGKLNDYSKVRDSYRCKECDHEWQTRKQRGEPPSCPRCSSKDIVNISKQNHA